ncbi:hypothetical protein [Streptosporangium saharense]|uniref:hypothetical protein n=1 Tax=Streptosporangium saharense TaxID=1706840 RepID=UPI003323429C
MILSVPLDGLSCAVCAEEALWQDVMRGLIECRSCGARAVAGELDGFDDDRFDDGDGFDDGFDDDGFDGFGGVG